MRNKVIVYLFGFFLFVALAGFSFEKLNYFKSLASLLTSIGLIIAQIL